MQLKTKYYLGKTFFRKYEELKETNALRAYSAQRRFDNILNLCS